MFVNNKLCLFIAGFMIVSVGFVYADSIKLKNGSYFEGRIIEDTGSTIKMKLALGVVEFKKSDLTDIVHSDEEENLAIEQRWGVGHTASQEVDGDPVERYLNKGKVKYQGRWVSEEVYDVIQKEQEIKEKRYRFLQDKKHEDKKESREAYMKEQQELLPSQRPAALVDGPLPFSERYKKFGKSSVAGKRTELVASSKEDEVTEPDVVGGLNKVNRFGAEKTKTLATTDNPYKEEGM